MTVPMLCSRAQAAEDYAALGFAVFPVAGDCRSPVIPSPVKGEGGVHKATSDPDEARGIWAKYPTANIAFACGAASGFFVLDVDCKAGGPDGFASLSALGFPLPPTWRVRTPSGGLHFYFRQPSRQLRNRVGFRPGLDIRTDGGSVAAPPSRKPAGEYIWLDAPWFMDLADAPIALLDLIDPPMPALPPSKPIPPGADRRYGEAALASECAELAAMKPNTGRNQALFIAAARMGELIAAGLLDQSRTEQALERSAIVCGLAAEDGFQSVRGTIANGLRAGQANPRRKSDVSPQLRAMRRDR